MTVPASLTTRDLLDVLRLTDGAPMSYSGRGMYGDRCLAARVEGCLVAFGADLQRALDEFTEGHAVPPALTDSLGRDTVVYWPGFNDEVVLREVDDAADDD
jgi:hypothetical protein